MSVVFTNNLNQASGAVVAAVLNSLWQAAAVAAVAWAGMRLARRMNAATRHLLWWAVLAVMLLLPVAALRPVRQAARRPAPWPTSTRLVVINADGPVLAPLATRIRTVPAGQGTTPVAVRAGRWPLWIVALWAAAALWQLTRVVWSYCYLRRLKFRAQRVSPELRSNFDAWMMSCGVRRPASLLVSDEIVSPMAVGFFHPAVILPASLLEQFREAELDHVLLHELAHIARQDDWTNLCARLAGAVFALHPVAAWVLRNIEREREIACDDWVVSMTGAARPYAASLARLFEICFVRRRMVLATGMTGRSSHLGDRIESLLRCTREFTPKASMTRVFLSTPILLLLVIAGAQAPRWLAFAQATPAPAAPAFSNRMVRYAPARYVPAAAAVRRATPNGGSFLAALVAAGYGNLSVDEIINLKNAGVSAQFLNGIAEAGLGPLSAQQMIDLCHSGVTPEYVRKVGDAGIRDLAFHDVIELATHGVRPEAIQEIHALGFGPYTARQVVDLTQVGLRPELFRALKDYGLTNASLPDIMDAHRAGLGAHSVGEARQYGPNLTLKQIIRLKTAGVI